VAHQVGDARILMRESLLELSDGHLMNAGHGLLPVSMERP
jgi:hypothetical protein